MADPLYPVGARVIYQQERVIVKHQAFECLGDSVYRFLGYEVGVYEGPVFSGWHPEAEIEADNER